MKNKKFDPFDCFEFKILTHTTLCTNFQFIIICNAFFHSLFYLLFPRRFSNFCCSFVCFLFAFRKRKRTINYIFRLLFILCTTQCTFKSWKNGNAVNMHANKPTNTRIFYVLILWTVIVAVSVVK